MVWVVGAGEVGSWLACVGNIRHRNVIYTRLAPHAKSNTSTACSSKALLGRTTKGHSEASTYLSGRPCLRPSIRGLRLVIWGRRATMWLPLTLHSYHVGWLRTRI